MAQKVDFEDCVSLPSEFQTKEKDQNNDEQSELEMIGCQLDKLIEKMNELRTFVVDIDKRVRRMEQNYADVCDCSIDDFCVGKY